MTDDIAVDPRWTPWRDLARAHGLRSCWSTPIFDSRRAVLGSLALYNLPSGPSSAEHLALIESATHLAAVAIERSRSETALRAGKERLARIVETNPNGVTILDRSGRITFANAAAESIFGLIRRAIAERVYNDPAWKITTLEGAPLPAEDLPFSRVTATGQVVQGFEHCIEHPDGRRMALSINAAPLRDAAGQTIGIVADITDITSRRQAEARLLTQRLTLATEAAVIGIWDWDLATDAWYATPIYFSMLGYAAGPGPLVPERWLAFLHPEDRARVEKRVAAVRSGSPEPYGYDARVRHADGTYRWMQVVGRVVASDSKGRPSRILGTRIDITVPRQVKQELQTAAEQMRALATRIERVREEERTWIAREIHVVLAQELTHLKIDLVWLARRLAVPLDEPWRGRCTKRIADAVMQADTAISTVQRIATELRPVVLDSLGLSAAAEWQVEDFARRTGLKCTVHVTARDAVLGRDRATAIFRILQESLTNVARHARAGTVAVELREADGPVTLVVRDDGIGIAPAVLADPRSIGLLGIRERALALGGTVEFSSAPGGGTAVTVDLPLAETAEVSTLP